MGFLCQVKAQSSFCNWINKAQYDFQIFAILNGKWLAFDIITIEIEENVV